MGGEPEVTNFGKTTVGEQRAEWAFTDGQITVLAFAGGDGDGIDMARFGQVNALWCEPDGVVFPDGLSLARVRSILPEYHGLWCQVSEQARVLGQKEPVKARSALLELPDS